MFQTPPGPGALSDDWELMDDTECKFNVNSYKMVYVVNSESYLYKRMALTRASGSHKHVSLNKHKLFSTWHDTWVGEHVTSDNKHKCSDWLMGKGKQRWSAVTNKVRLLDVLPHDMHVFLVHFHI